MHLAHVVARRFHGLSLALLTVSSLLTMKPSCASAAENPKMAASSEVHALADDPKCTADDRRFMTRAYELARSAIKHGNQPFGAVLVKDGKIIFEYENTVFSTKDLTQHAENGLIGKASQKFDPATLAACTLYASTESCMMCCGSIRWSGIRRVVYGTSAAQLTRVIGALLPPEPAPTFAALEIRELFARSEPSIQVFGPLMEAEGLVIQKNYWPNDPILKPMMVKR